MPTQETTSSRQEFGESATWERLLADSQKLIAVQDLNSLLPKIPETVSAVLGADIVILYEYREETDDVNLPPVVWGDLQRPEILMEKSVIRPHKQSAVFKMLDKRRKEPIYASDAKQDWDRLIGLLPYEHKGSKREDFVHRESIVSSAAVSLRADGKRVGVLFVNYHNHHTFPNEERKAIELFAAQVAIAIQNARLFQRERERSNALDLIQKASARIGASLDETATLDLIINGAMQLLGMDSGVIHLVDVAKQAVIRSYEAPPDFGHPVPRFSERKGRTWWVVTTGKMVVVPDITKDDSLHPRMSQMNVRAVLSAPLKVDGKVIGVLSLNDSKMHKFTEYEKTLLTTLADHAAIAIQNARLFQRERERSSALELVRQASAKIIASLDETATLDLIINGAMQLLGMDSGVIHLVDEAKQAVIRSYEAPPDFGHPVPRFSERKGRTWGVVTTGEMVVVPDITKDDSIHPRMSQMNVRAVLSAPLKVGGKVIGVLSLNDSKVHEFTEYEQTLLTMLADTAAIAIQNTQREKKRREAETLASINAFGANFVHKVINLLGTLPANFKQVAQAVKRSDQKTLDLHLALLEKDVQSVRQIMQAAKDLRSFGQGARQPLQINEVLQEAVLEAHLPADIHLETMFDPALPLMTANRITMSNLLGNLISNAVNAMTHGGVLRLATCPSDDRKSIIVTVKDTGTGIPEDIRARIFEPFYTTRGDGLGLGLWLARLTMQEIGGEIEFVSECDKGTVFTIRLPVQ
jgi:two-component system, NtrC family, sensor kinase